MFPCKDCLVLSICIEAYCCPIVEDYMRSVLFYDVAITNFPDNTCPRCGNKSIRDHMLLSCTICTWEQDTWRCNYYNLNKTKRD